jgi:hypothetical protein
MRLTDEAQGAVEFGRFRLLPHRRELRADGVAIELGSRAFDILTVWNPKAAPDKSAPLLRFFSTLIAISGGERG